MDSSEDVTSLPVIVGFGGINAAGRSSSHHAYRRMVLDALPQKDADETWRSLAALMGVELLDGRVDAGTRQYLLAHTLVRRIEDSHFDGSRVPWNRRFRMRPRQHGTLCFETRAHHLPIPVPESWRVRDLGGGEVEVAVESDLDLLLPSEREFEVNSAGLLPTGFDPRTLYPARNHPRGLQMTVYGASDAVQSLGFEWQEIASRVDPDQVSVYAGSGMGQLDGQGSAGMLAARAHGKRVTSKHCPFGFAEMPADFINAYVLGSVGSTGTSMGACASFLYNLRQGINDIQSGRARAVLVGNSEAPVTPEVMDGYAAMGALATDAELIDLDGLQKAGRPDHRRACRPFAQNCGFTIAESAQFLVLVDDALALELGANLHGAVSDVFVNADGHKKSISSPGVGNYITVAKAMASVRALLGEHSLRRHSLVQAHGTGTPQNRVTESHILNELARTFGIERWPLVAVKCFLGHSIGAAAGDQVAATLGIWRYGILPGVTTIDEVADDVEASNLDIRNAHQEREAARLEAAIVNAKGFGGNNASAALLAPRVVERMLSKRHGRRAMVAWRERNEAVAEQAARYDQQARNGQAGPIYRFDHGVLGGDDVEMTAERMALRGFDRDIDLRLETPYTDMI